MRRRRVGDASASRRGRVGDALRRLCIGDAFTIRRQRIGEASASCQIRVGNAFALVPGSLLMR